jgi:hypothetical protein
MSKIAVSLKIDLSKIDMSKVFQGKNGAQYLDMTAFVSLTELDQYDNSGMITQSVKKEEKEQGIKGNILGNSKVFWVEGGQAPQKAVNNQGYQQQAPVQQAPPQQGYSNQSPQQQQQPYQQQQQPAPQQQQAPFDPNNIPY